MIEWLVAWRPVYRLMLTSEHTALLTKLSQLHYSPECIVAGRQGGFLFGWANQAAWAAPNDPPPAMSGGDRELDICLKIMEMSDTPGLLTREERDVRDLLRAAIRLALAAGSREPG